MQNPKAILEQIHEMEMDFGSAGRHTVQVFYTFEDDEIKLLRIKLFAWDVTSLFDPLILEDVRFEIQDERWKKEDSRDEEKHFKAWKDA